MAGFLTNSGLAKLAVATPLTPMTVKHMAFDKGQGTPSPTMTALFDEAYRTEIPNPTKDPDNPKNLTFSGFVPTTVGGWTIYGIGLFDSLGVLIAYLQLADPVMKSDPSSALKMSWQQDFIITLANAGETDLIITDSIEFRHDALTNRNDPNAHPIAAITGLQDALASINTSIADKDAQNVKLTGDQLIEGVKSFNDHIETESIKNGNATITLENDGAALSAGSGPNFAGVSVDGTNKTVQVTGGFSAIDMPDFTGMVVAFAMNSAPNGWLACSGQAVSRTDYAKLFAKIGTIYGTGNGSTTFNLPELRGEFVRGHSGARTVDVGRAFGSAQADDLKAHSHQAPSSNGGPGPYEVPTEPTAGYDYVKSAPSQETGGTETRPRNVAMLYCIKI